MVCFCFHRNKVGPLRPIEIPDITAVPEGGATAVDNANTVEANSENLEVSAIEEASQGNTEAKGKVLPEPGEHSESQTESEDTSPSAELSNSVDSQSSATSQDSSVPSGRESWSPVPGGSALGRDPSCFGTIPSPEESSAISDYGREGISVGGAGEETVIDSVEKPVGPSPEADHDLEEDVKVSKRTFGRFDVYSLSDCLLDAGADPKAKEAVNERPLVIMIPWLNAQPRHVQKYNDLYVKKGMDVLHLHVTPMQILRPLRTKKVIGQLLTLLTDEEGCFAGRPILVHGFSIGAFVWGQMLVEMDAAAAAAAAAADDAGDVSADNNVDDSRGDVPQAQSEASAALQYSSGPEANVSPSATKPDSRGDVERSVGSGSAASTKPERSDTTEDNKLGDNDNKNNSPKTKPASIAATSTTASSTSTDSATAPSTTTTSSSNTAVLHRIMGVVMDSPTPLANLLDGIPSSLSHNAVVKAAIKTSLSSYLRLFPNSVHAHYVQGEEACRSNSQGLPLLILYSSADIVAQGDRLDDFVDSWVGRGLRVRARKWEDSPHVGHFKHYPEEYREEVEMFLEELFQSNKAKE